MTLTISAHQTLLLRIHAQRLFLASSAEIVSPAGVLNGICGVQAQDLAAALLSIRARSLDLTAEAVERARQVERQIVWTWCMRGTLHLVTAEDARWLIPFLGPAFIAADQRRFRQLGWDETSAVSGLRLLRSALDERGALTRSEVIHLLEEHGLPSQGQAPVHLLYRAAFESLLCMGDDRGNKPAYVPFESWLGEPRALRPEVALAELARRYIGAYGPAAPQDFARWSGLKLGDARQAWELIAHQLVQVQAAGQPAWILEDAFDGLDGRLEELTRASPHVCLLPRFDTYLLGYANRDLVVDPAYARRVHPGGGLIYPVLLVDGRVLGTWKIKRRTAYLEVLVEPFATLVDTLLPYIAAEAADIGRFLEVEVVLTIERPQA